jgi:hypothetical protein
MDTSVEYIDMCRKAVEILVQGMVKNDDELLHFMGRAYIIMDNNREYFNEFSSMEQLWLAFVMREKYGKKWDGKEWT